MKKKKRSGLRATVGGWLVAIGSFVGAYSSTSKTKKSLWESERPRPLTSNQALGGSLTDLTAQGRHVERTTPLGRASREGLVADVVASGIDVLPDTGDEKLNDAIHDVFLDWAEHAIVNGRSLWAWQRVNMGELATSGAGLSRWVVLEDRKKKGWLPVCILPLEVEWLSEVPGYIAPGNTFVRGIECDIFGRPQFYHLRNPELVGVEVERVPAEKIIHPFEWRRGQQYHGEPMMAPGIERMVQDGRLVETELGAAVSTSAPALAITTQDDSEEEEDEDGDPVTDIPMGATVRLRPGEDVKSVQNNRPSQLIDPFRSGIKGDVAATMRVSKVHLDRDSSKANYSSMRMDQLLGKRLTVGIKEELGFATAAEIYAYVLPWIFIELGLEWPSNPKDQARMRKIQLRPDQPEYVDPVKDVQASENAINSDQSNLDIELSSRGKDWKRIAIQRQKEVKLLDQNKIERIKALQIACDKANKETPGLDLKWQDLLETTPAAEKQVPQAAAPAQIQPE